MDGICINTAHCCMDKRGRESAKWSVVPASQSSICECQEAMSFALKTKAHSPSSLLLHGKGTETVSGASPCPEQIGFQGPPSPGEGMIHTLILRKGSGLCCQEGRLWRWWVHGKGPEHPFFLSRELDTQIFRNNIAARPWRDHAEVSSHCKAS